MIDRHYQLLRDSGEWQRRERARLQAQLDLILQSTLVARWRSTISEKDYAEVLQGLVSREISPWQAVADLLKGGYE
jgi:hypothetical protein